MTFRETTTRCRQIAAAVPSLVVPPSDELIAYGHAGRRVQLLQESLKLLGSPFKVFGTDGIFGDETWEHFTDFQTRAGITVDGIYGSESERAMLKAFKRLDDDYWHKAADTFGYVYSKSFKGFVSGFADIGNTTAYYN